MNKNNNDNLVVASEKVLNLDTVKGMLLLPLPDDLGERRALLESKLRETVQELVGAKIKEALNEIIDKVSLEEKPVKVTWEYHPESDDEGGTDWWISYINLHGESGYIDTEDVEVMMKYSWSDTEYEVSLDEALQEILSDWRDDLYRYNIEEVLL